MYTLTHDTPKGLRVVKFTPYKNGLVLITDCTQRPRGGDEFSEFVLPGADARNLWQDYSTRMVKS